jgi:hypothetical protein
MSAWSMKFKRRMMQLEIAVKDVETEKIYTVNKNTPMKFTSRPIHRDLYDDLNADRIENGLDVLDIPDDIIFDNWEGRGFKHKFTGEFMQAETAGNWASEDGYDNNYWGGESLRLRRIQDIMIEEA